jgi:hypothetical protein
MSWRTLLTITLVLLLSGALLPQEVPQRDVQDVRDSLPQYSWLRPWLSRGERKAAKDQPYMQRMRQAGVRRVFFELGSVWRSGKPQDIRILTRLYFDKYDGPRSQIAEPRSIEAIRTNGLEALLDNVAIDWAKERPLLTGREHAIVRHPEGKQMSTTAELFDDSRLPGMVIPWTPWSGRKGPPLSEAAITGDASEVARLLQTNKFSQQDLNVVLLEAVKNHYDNSDVIDLLLKAGADINGRDPSSGWTALIIAIDRPIQLLTLVERGADLNARDPQGSTALQLARRQGDREAVQILEKAGAKN